MGVWSEGDYFQWFRNILRGCESGSRAFAFPDFVADGELVELVAAVAPVGEELVH